MLFDRQWVSGYGVADTDEKGWLIELEVGQSEHVPSPVASIDTETALLPDQCPECFEAGAHADDCRVARNITAGVPEFWAPWAHFEVPKQTHHKVYQLVGGELVKMADSADLGCVAEWCVDEGDWADELGAHEGRPWIALGPNGAPTNEPWEK